MSALKTVSRMMAPFMPFLSEAVYQELGEANQHR